MIVSVSAGVIAKPGTAAVVSAPVFTVQPSDSSAIDTGTVTFSCLATNSPSYQWQEYDGFDWGNISGATSNVYTRTASTGDNGYLFRCVATNGSGSTNSSSATLTIVTAVDLQRATGVLVEAFGHLYAPVEQQASGVLVETYGHIYSPVEQQAAGVLVEAWGHAYSPTEQQAAGVLIEVWGDTSTSLY